MLDNKFNILAQLSLLAGGQVGKYVTTAAERAEQSSDKQGSEVEEISEKEIMAAKDDGEMGLANSEDMLREIQLLQLQEKRMRKLVDQRKEERKELELENSRMQRQKKYMEEMAQENDDAEEEYMRQMAAKGPFAGKGNMLGAPSPAPAAAAGPSRPVRQVQPVVVDTSKPVGNVQVGYSLVFIWCVFIQWGLVCILIWLVCVEGALCVS